MHRQFIKFILGTPPAFVLASEIVVGSFLIIFSSFIFAQLTNQILNSEKIFFDATITQFVDTFKSPLVTHLMLFFSFLGSSLILSLSVVIIGVLVIKKYKKESLLFFLIVVMGIVVNSLLKLFIQRPRPTLNPLIVEPYYSFPSGHSMNAFIFYMTIAYLTYHFTRNKKITCIVFTISAFIIFLIGISRIYLGVHYPSDVLGGYIAGFWWFVTIIIIDRTISLYGLFRIYRQNNIVS